MKNIKATLKGNVLTLEVDVTKTYGDSKSGKTTIIASSEGNQPVDGAEGVKFGLNVYRGK